MVLIEQTTPVYLKIMYLFIGSESEEMNCATDLSPTGVTAGLNGSKSEEMNCTTDLSTTVVTAGLNGL